MFRDVSVELPFTLTHPKAEEPELAFQSEVIPGTLTNSNSIDRKDTVYRISWFRKKWDVEKMDAHFEV